ncbi:MAG: adenine-specific methylase [Clostridiaceae bacterium]|nr:adenine-specific methylase [Clostridiaceae bacterium]
MEERLELLKEMLDDDGAIAIHIDDKEYATLKNIMDKVFGVENYVNTFILKRGTKNLNNQFKKVSSLNRAFEFLVVYKKSNKFYYKNAYKDTSDKRKGGYWTSFKSNADRPTMRYEIDGVMIDKGQWKWSKEKGLRALVNYKKYEELYMKNMTLKEYWEKYRDSYEKETGFELEFVRRHKNSVQYWVEPADETLMDTDMMEYYINDNQGKKKFGFDTVKNINTVKKIISMFTDKNSKILDYYAGSGTTGCAVMELNHEDGGNRIFVLITNDENNICTDICFPRISNTAKIYEKELDYIILEDKR